MASFKDAFAKARKDGKSKFKWDGKEYTTKLKSSGSGSSGSSRSSGAKTSPAKPSPQPTSLGDIKGPPTTMSSRGGSGTPPSSRKTRSSASSGSASSDRRSRRSRSETSASSKPKSSNGGGSLVTGKTKTKGGTYPTFKKDSVIAKDFKSAFAKARREGKSTFMWDGRKYSTKTK